MKSFCATPTWILSIISIVNRKNGSNSAIIVIISEAEELLHTQAEVIELI